MCKLKQAVQNPFALIDGNGSAVESIRQYISLIEQGAEPLDAAIATAKQHNLLLTGNYCNPSRSEFMAALQEYKRSLHESPDSRQLTTTGNTSKL